MKRLVLILLVLVFLAPFTSAQEDRGRISGLVTDQMGAVIPKADVFLLNEATGVQLNTVTNEAGIYSFDLLISDLYTVEVNARGFKKFSLRHVRIESGGRVGVPATLQIGNADDSITVTATNATLLKTEDAIIGSTLETRSVEELPSINLQDLQWLTPGVVSTTLTNGSGAESTSINGAQSGRTEFTLDGAPNSRNGGAVTVAFTPAEKMVDEFHMITSPYDASLAHTAGASMDMSLKSGTSEYHGSFYGKYQNPNVDAPQFSQGTATPPSQRLDSENVNVGGPILHHKLFFFAGYQRTHNSSAASTSTQTIPTQNEIKGDFSSLLSVGKQITTKYICPSTKATITYGPVNSYQIFDPRTTIPDPQCTGYFLRTPVTGNLISNSAYGTVDQVATAILNYFPKNPTGSATLTADGHNNFVSTAANLNRTWQEVNRIDYTINNSQKLFGHFITGGYTQPGKNAFFPHASGKSTVYKNNAGVIDYINTLNAKTVLNVRYSLTRFSTSTTIDAKTTATDLGVNTNALATIPAKFKGFPYVAFSDGFAELGNADPGFEGDTIHDAQVNLDRSLGRHQIKFGTEWRRYQADQADYTNAKLYMKEAGTYTRGPSSSSTAASIGQGLAEMEMGLEEGAQEKIPVATANNTVYWSGYAQDDWKALPNLSINIGLRYEYFGAIQERNGKSITYFDPTIQSPISGAVVANYAATAVTTELATLPVSNFTSINGGLHFATPGAGIWTPQKYNFSPRFGFSYNPIPKLVVRGGFGIFYQHIGELQQYGQTDGFSQTTNTDITNDHGQTYIATLANPFPSGLSQPTDNKQGYYQDIGTGISQWFLAHPKSPISIHFSLGVQYALPGDFTVEADYVGNLSSHMRITRNWNALPNSYLSTDTTRTAAMTALSGVLSVGYANPFNNSNLNLPSYVPTQSMLTSSTMSLSQLLKPYPQFSGISGTDTAGFSNYNSLQVMLQKRFSHGYNMSAMYTWSRTLDEITFLNAAAAKPWYGTSNSDYPQVLSLSAIYELPFGTDKPFLSTAPRWVRELTGFQVEGTYRIQSGQPLTFGADSVLKSGMTFADINGSSKHNIHQWFNTNAFWSYLDDQNYGQDYALGWHVRTFPLRFNNVRQDYQNMLNVGAMKKFDFNVAHRTVNAKFRAEAVNAMNHQVFTSPTTDPGSSSFGIISGPGNSSRYLQFGLTMDF